MGIERIKVISFFRKNMFISESNFKDIRNVLKEELIDYNYDNFYYSINHL